VSYQGYDYATVLIGDQCWFAENLRSEAYANGDTIPSGVIRQGWYVANFGACEVYGGVTSETACWDNSPDIDACDPAQSLNEYGRLYNWYAVDDERGLCPNGWHVPSDEEWSDLEISLGMPEIEADSVGWRSTDHGRQMKTTYGWHDGGNGTNSSGFSGLPGGCRDGGASTFILGGHHAYWWSSSPPYFSDDYYNGEWGRVWARSMNWSQERVFRSSYILQFGFSVRCLKDVE
jgi:uncharacterized protein (TIGR02145 family)